MAFILIHIRERFLAAGESKSRIHKTLGYLPHKWCFYWAGGWGCRMCLLHTRNAYLRFINPPPLPRLTEGNLSQFATEVREGESDPPSVPAPEIGVSRGTTCALNTGTNSTMCCDRARSAQIQPRWQQGQTSRRDSQPSTPASCHDASHPAILTHFFKTGRRVSSLKYPLRYWQGKRISCEDRKQAQRLWDTTKKGI